MRGKAQRAEQRQHNAQTHSSQRSAACNSNGVGGAMLSLAGLSFLGLGAQAPAAEWGSMLSDGRGLMQKAPWIVFYPGLAVFVSSILFNLMGDSVRDVLDPLDSRNIFSKVKKKGIN